MADVVLPWRQGSGAAPSAKPKASGIPAIAAVQQQRQLAARPQLATQVGDVKLPWRSATNTNTQQAAKAVTAKPKGLLGQAGEIVEKTPAGLGHFVGGVAHDLFVSPAYEIKRGVQHPLGGGQIEHRPETHKEVAASFERTAGDVRHPGRYVDAYHQGTLVGKVLEDVANASVVGSLASAPLRAAAGRAAAESVAARAAEEGALRNVIAGAPAAELEQAAARRAVAESAAQRLAPVGRAGDIIHSVSTLGAQGANLPIKPIEVGAELLGKGLRGLGGVELGVEGRTLGQAFAESGLGRAASKVGDIARERRYSLNLKTDKSVIGRQARHQAEAAAYAGAHGLTPAENQAATILFDEGVTDPARRAANRALIDNLGEEDALGRIAAGYNQHVADLGIKGKEAEAYTVTPEAVKLAMDYHDGLLDPEVAARLQRGNESLGHIGDVVVPVQEQGRLTPLDQEQLGTRPLTAKTEAHPVVQRRREELAAADEVVGKARSKAELEAARAAQRQAEVEGREATTVGRIEEGGQVQHRLEERRVQTAELASRLRERAVAERLRGDVRAAAATEAAARRATAMEERSAARVVRQPKPEPALTAAEEYAASQQRVQADVDRRLQLATEEADRAAHLRSAGPGVAYEPTVQAMERRSERRLGQAERGEATAGRLRARSSAAVEEATARLEKIAAETARHEGEVTRAQAVREAGETSAQLIASRANDVAALTERSAGAAEGRLGVMAEQTPLRDVAEREVGRVTRAGEKSGAAGERYRVAQKELDRAITTRNRAAKALEDERAKRWDSLDAAPARYRYAIAMSRAADTVGRDVVAELRSKGADFAADQIEGLLDDAATGLEGFVAAGIDPRYLPGGKDPYAQAERSRISELQVSPGEFSVRQRKLGSELDRQTVLRPTSIQGRAAIAIREIDQAVQNMTAKQLMTERGVTPEAAGIEVTPQLLAGGGAGLRAAMAEQGLEPFDPNTIYSTPATITADTVFVPTELKRQIGAYFKPEGAYETIMKTAFDPVRRGWKHMVLPLSGRWHVGNIVSNAVMNTIGTGSLAWMGELPEAWRAARAEGHGVSGVPARLFGVSAEAELRDFIRRSTGREPNAVMRLIDKSYKLNTFVDDLSRSAVFLSEQKRNLAGGMTVQQAEDEALRTALKVSGDFGRLTEFERGVVRRAVPFYTWARHVTQLVSHLAVENPIRLVWTLNLANLYAPENTGPFGDSIPVAGKLVSVGNLSPLGTFENLWMNPKGPGAGALQSLGPELDVGAAALLGTNLGRGGQPLRMSPGSGRLDEFGNPVNTPLLGRPRDLLGYATRKVPLVNTARQFREGRKIAEYDTGQPMLRGGKLIDSTPTIVGTNVGGRLGILAGQLGVPVGTTFDVEQIQATAAKRRETAAKARARYQKQLAKARKG